MRYLFNVLIGLDQFGNTLAGGNPDETISSRVGRAARKGKRRAILLEALINLIFALPPISQRGHCEASIENFN